MFGKKKEKEEDRMIETSIGKISKDTLIHNKELVRRMFEEEIEKCNTAYRDEFDDLRHFLLNWLSGRDWYDTGYSQYAYEEKILKGEERTEALSKVTSTEPNEVWNLIEQLCAEASIDKIRKEELRQEMEELGL